MSESKHLHFGQISTKFEYFGIIWDKYFDVKHDSKSGKQSQYRSTPKCNVCSLEQIINRYNSSLKDTTSELN